MHFSMSLRFVAGSLVFVVGAAHAAPLETTAAQVLDQVLVTASPVNETADRAMRSVSIISREQIERSSAQNLADVLALETGLVIRRRGAYGVQTDVGIRDGSFNQTLVLLDGIPLQNPQTGHHNLDAPVPLAHIERIEIIKGPGAIQYGGSATSGVINIITRDAEERHAGVGVTLGSHTSRQAGAHLGGSGQFVSLDGGRTDGSSTDEPNDARTRNALYTGRGGLDRLEFQWGAGTSSKEFGAWAFYSEDFPDARERTTSDMAWVEMRLPQSQWQLRSSVYWRHHTDWFLTRIAGVDYINEHSTDTHGFRGDVQREHHGGTTALGVELRKEKIDSNALSRHNRDRNAFWVYRRQQLSDAWSAEASLSRVDYGDYDSHWLPSFGLSLQLTDNWRSYASVARSTREPTYTELYLSTAANQGKGELGPERSTYGELGLEGRFDAYTFQASVYQRRTDDFIDWARLPGEVTWRADNFDDYRARGSELSLRWQPGWEHVGAVGISHERLLVKLDAGGRETQYALQVPDQTWRADVQFDLGGSAGLSLQARRPHYRHQATATLLSSRLDWRMGKLQAYVDAQNILDEKIIETGFAAIPGRWLSVGVEMAY